jgi:hypothetical protein
MRAQQRIRTWQYIVLAASCQACNAKITRFDAIPRHVCPGDRVELAWEFTGTGTLTVTPPVPPAPAGRVPDHGTASISPTAPTAVELRVTRTGGRSTGARLDIEMNQGELVAASIADPSATCRDSVVASTAHVRNFAPDLVVAVVGVRPGDERSYDVSHFDQRTQQLVTARVSSAAPTTRFAGLPIVGDWILSSPLSPGASCDSPGLPSNLVVIAYTRCASGDPP